MGEAIIGSLSADEYPHFAAGGADLMASGFAYARAFEFGLDLILDGLERMAAGGVGQVRGSLDPDWIE